MTSLFCRMSDRILDSITEGVFTVGQDMEINYFNRSAEKITGVSREDAIGRKCFNVFRANICQSACILKQSIETGREIVNRKVNIINSKGCTVPITIRTSVLRDENGLIIGGVETFRDISAIEVLRKEISKQYVFEEIISKNYKIQQILSTLPDIATSGSSVLIEGPSGSGKELFARAIHKLSGRKGKFIALNCAALPDTLLESELFGYKKGAFTGANADKKGRFALAAQGTIFLDEIGDISPALQLRLLRVLQEKEYEPLGGTETIATDARVVAATNKNLKELVAGDQFRDDLFFRINVIKISIPPLSQHREDIPLLVEHFLTKFNQLKDKSIDSISPEVLNALMRHDYPGNIRELENIIEFCFVLCHGHQIETDHLPAEFLETITAFPSVNASHGEHSPLSSHEGKVILDTLRRFQGRRTDAARHLGVSTTTL
ncbi:MAG: sigma 54-interacting transcriptional regulator, partial [Desulfobulbales bacterium]|nr:sigma 54-interacting transcriptional regulator [Desulfobulbales bacterium]